MKTITFKKLATASAIALAVVASPVANAGSMLANILNIGQVNQIEDTNADRILRQNTAGTGAVTLRSGLTYDVLNGTQSIAAGDIIQSILLFNNLNGTPIYLNGAPYNTASYGVVAYSELQVGTIDTSVGDGLARYYAQASGNLQGTNSLVELYENGAPLDNASLLNLFTTSTPATAINTITTPGSTFVQSFGLRDSQDFWQIRTPDAPLSVLLGATPGSGQQGLYEFGLSITSTGPLALPILADGVTSGASVANSGNPLSHRNTLHDVAGDGSAFALSPSTNPGWQLSSNTTVVFNTVPEPELLVLLSAGLLAGGFARRRSNV